MNLSYQYTGAKKIARLIVKLLPSWNCPYSNIEMFTVQIANTEIRIISTEGTCSCEGRTLMRDVGLGSLDLPDNSIEIHYFNITL